MKHRPPGFLPLLYYRIDVAEISIKQHFKTVLGPHARYEYCTSTLAQDLKSSVQLPNLVPVRVPAAACRHQFFCFLEPYYEAGKLLPNFGMGCPTLIIG